MHTIKNATESKGAMTKSNNHSLSTFHACASGNTLATKMVCNIYIPNVHWPYLAHAVTFALFWHVLYITDIVDIVAKQPVNATQYLNNIRCDLPRIEGIFISM